MKQTVHPVIVSLLKANVTILSGLEEAWKQRIITFCFAKLIMTVSPFEIASSRETRDSQRMRILFCLAELAKDNGVRANTQFAPTGHCPLDTDHLFI